MPNNMLTKCPHCGTTFRLTVEQLKVAGGAVRCGACYHVFHAAGHFVDSTAPSTPNPPQKPKDVFSDSPRQGPSSFDAKIPKLGGEEPATPSAAPPPSNPKPANKKPFADDSWAEAMLKELGEDLEDDEGSRSTTSTISSEGVFNLDDDKPAPVKKPQQKTAFTDSELSDTFLNLGSFSSDDPFAIHDFDEDKAGDADVKDDESWAKAILDELEHDDSAPKKESGFSILMDDDHDPKNRSPYAARPKKERDSEAFKTFEQAKEQRNARHRQSIKHINPLRNDETEEFFSQFESSGTAPPKPAEATPAPQRTKPKETLQDLENFDSEEFSTGELFADTDDVKKRQARIRARKAAQQQIKVERNYSLWFGLGCLLLLIALSIQYSYFHFEQVARNSALRPILEKACVAFSCQLPHQVDVSKVVSSRLIVRSHPRANNALIIDAVIKNLAGFVQPFPDIQLSFEDMNGNPVASRRFKPSEYIQDKQINLNAMPNGTPIHLNLEIVDPGLKAVNYQLKFLPQS